MMGNPLSNLKALMGRASKVMQEYQSSVEDIRRAIIDLRDTQRDVETAPVSVREIEANVDQVLGDAEKRARSVFIPSTFVSPRHPDRLRPEFDAPFRKDTLGALCILGFREPVRAALLAEAKKEAEGRKTYSADARAAELTRLQKELETLEAAEESLIREAEEAGLTVPRRADARPEILLAERV
ncbi:hypothetical protein [Nitratireductor sp. CH_MIT9313-5]|uniref:hypothetical protein n=1 Tax=Nitratireductor sp. CH_MIT9313-5 TaxID=3107764 RepID=UPI00300AE3BE